MALAKQEYPHTPSRLGPNPHTTGIDLDCSPHLRETLPHPGSRPSVSVIVIFRNPGAFLTEAIESVLSQTYTAWELLLVDDGSTDESVEIAHSFVASRPHQIRYLQHPGGGNLGMSRSRNLGLEHARGDLIGFLDADDVLSPTAIEEQERILSDHPEACMVFGPVERWWSWNGAGSGSRRDVVHRPYARYDTILRPPELLRSMLRLKFAVPLGVLIRRSDMLRVGGYEDEFRGLFEDQVFFAKVGLHAPVFLSGHCWYRYRQHPRSATASSPGRREAREKFLEWLEGYLPEVGCDDAVIRSGVARWRWRLKHPRLSAWLGRLGEAAARLRLLMVREHEYPKPFAVEVRSRLTPASFPDEARAPVTDPSASGR
jgi:glycosyltransferase involved in cell wall biosynthesis